MLHTAADPHSHSHLSCTVGGVALRPGVVVVRGLRWILRLDMLPQPCPPSSSSIHSPIGLVKEIRHILYALLPSGRVAMSPGGAVHGGGGGGGVPWGRGLSVDVAASWLPGFEGRVGEQRVSSGLWETRVLKMTGGDGDGEWGMEVVVCWQ